MSEQNEPEDRNSKTQSGKDTLPEIQQDTLVKTSAESLQPGDIVRGMYQVTHLLGEGGVNRVYRVHDPRRNEGLAMKVPRLFPGVARAGGKLLQEALGKRGVL